MIKLRKTNDALTYGMTAMRQSRIFHLSVAIQIKLKKDHMHRKKQLKRKREAEEVLN